MPHDAQPGPLGEELCLPQTFAGHTEHFTRQAYHACLPHPLGSDAQPGPLTLLPTRPGKNHFTPPDYIPLPDSNRWPNTQRYHLNTQTRDVNTQSRDVNRQSRHLNTQTCDVNRQRLVKNKQNCHVSRQRRDVNTQRRYVNRQSCNVNTQRRAVSTQKRAKSRPTCPVNRPQRAANTQNVAKDSPFTARRTFSSIRHSQFSLRHSLTYA